MAQAPLAASLRPFSLDEFSGQSPLVGPGGPIRKLIEQNVPSSLIFWGPPGVGKTSLAYILNEAWQTEWHAINATLASIQDIKRIIEVAREDRRYGKKSVLFIDEIHRFSKTQQDALLSVLEDGTLTLIGATTENPRFSVIPGVVSRCLVFELKPLSDTELAFVLEQALEKVLPTLQISPQIKQRLIACSAGDARKLCNIIEFIAKCIQPEAPLTLDHIETLLPQAARTLDDTTHYDMSSALIKSLRGSDPDAALYWTARLLESGEDPVFIARRMVIFASEDIGNADPQAFILSQAGMQAAQNIGMPEARIILGQLATYLASAPKSNASYTAINAAIAKVKAGDLQPVPPHLRTQQSQAMSAEKSGSGYLYPHNYAYAVVTQSYWDQSDTFYHPKEIGFEREIKKRLEWMAKQKDPTL